MAVRTFVVRVMKVVLPAAALVMTTLVLTWSYFSPDRDKFRIGFAETGEAEDDVSMLNARLAGADSKNQPFNISADKVHNLMPGSEQMTLEAPAADILLADGSWVMARADLGEYRTKEMSLDLIGSVKLFHDSGYEFRTSRATVDLSGAVVSGTDPVQGQGPLGELTAQGFQVADHGKSIVFHGKARLLLYPNAMKRR
jgi:lipopolysaccharide export system protein LptC